MPNDEKNGKPPRIPPAEGAKNKTNLRMQAATQPLQKKMPAFCCALGGI